jgi:hypothetical protein
MASIALRVSSIRGVLQPFTMRATFKSAGAWLVNELQCSVAFDS